MPVTHILLKIIFFYHKMYSLVTTKLNQSSVVMDHELWEAIQGNSERAFATLFHRYSTKIYSTAYSYIRDPVVCEQIVHDIFITLWSTRHTLEIQSFKAYLTSAARYRVYKHIAASKIYPIDYKETMEERVYENYTSQNEGYNNLISKEMELEVDSYLAHLPQRCRQIFLMSRRELLSNEEIANELGISKRSVENQITFALRHLRFSLKDVSVVLIILEGLTHLHS